MRRTHYEIDRLRIVPATDEDTTVLPTKVKVFIIIKWVIPCEIIQKSAILTPNLFDFSEN